jgi:hypothetical protein
VGWLEGEDKRMREETTDREVRRLVKMKVGRELTKLKAEFQEKKEELIAEDQRRVAILNAEDHKRHEAYLGKVASLNAQMKRRRDDRMTRKKVIHRMFDVAIGLDQLANPIIPEPDDPLKRKK